MVASIYACSYTIEESRVLGCCCDDMVVADHSVRQSVVFLGVDGRGERVSLAVVLALYELSSVIGFFEFGCPVGLLWSIRAYCVEVLKVSVVITDLDSVLGAPEVVGPVLEGHNNSKEFLFVDCVASFSWGKLL